MGLRRLFSRLADLSDPAQLLRMPRQLMPKRVVTPAHGAELLFESIAITQGALCIECMVCSGRSALNRQNCASIRPGNKRPVKSVTFRCQNRGCASNGVWIYNAHTQEEAIRWVAGDPLPEARRVT